MIKLAILLLVAACAVQAAPPAKQCRMRCEHGFQKDDEGQEICKCNPPPPPKKQCRMLCPFGFEKDEEGKDICKCKKPEIMCMMHCVHGMQKVDGKTICKCNPPPPDQDLPVLCRMWCPNGFETDKDGKEICKCKPAVCKVGEKTYPVGAKWGCKLGDRFSCTCRSNGRPICMQPRCARPPGPCKPVDTEQCCPRKWNCPPKPTCSPITCRIHCPNGFEQDRNGCDMCKCKPCKPVMCRMMCKDGYEKNEKGCDICKCKKPLIVNQEDPESPLLPPPKMCKMFCPHGFQKGEDGKPICKCNKRPICPLTGCPPHLCKETGFLKDKNGCQVGCRCAPPKLCKMFCQHGFQKGKDGKPICKCNERPICPLTGCPPHLCKETGFLKDKNGCQVACRCALPKLCKMFCQHGFQKDKDGKPICKCNERPICPPTGCPPHLCKETGFLEDKNGCRVGCRCNPKL